jgi:uncharacterized membrane protein
MKTKEFVRREIVNWIFLLLPFIYLAIVREKLPGFAPFRLNEEQTIYQVLLFVMGISFFWYIIYLIKPLVVPKTAFHNNLKSFYRVGTLMLAFTSILSVSFISEKIGIQFNWARICFILGMVFMLAIGNLYPTLKFNYFFGIRNAWTQSSEIIWRKTHLLGGRIFFLGGLAGALYGLFFNVHPVPYMPVIYVGYVFILGFVPVIYSYFLFRRFQSM